ncbi:hypothetical protein PFISCL1PPCAC_10764, partial [Pristionchus fissidentatus]
QFVHGKYFTKVSKSYAPGWVRTTDLSVNSRTRCRLRHGSDENVGTQLALLFGRIHISLYHGKDDFACDSLDQERFLGISFFCFGLFVHYDQFVLPNWPLISDDQRSHVKIHRLIWIEKCKHWTHFEERIVAASNLPYNSLSALVSDDMFARSSYIDKLSEGRIDVQFEWGRRRGRLICRKGEEFHGVDVAELLDHLQFAIARL